MHSKQEYSASKVKFEISSYSPNLPSSSYGHKSTLTSSKIKISFTNNGSHTVFTLISDLGDAIENSWMAIGLNVESGMVIKLKKHKKAFKKIIILIHLYSHCKNGASVIVCLNPLQGNKTVQHYYNSKYRSYLLDLSNPTIGISSSSINVYDKSLVCSFTRENSNTNRKYFNLNTQLPYIISAYGPLDASGSTFLS